VIDFISARKRRARAKSSDDMTDEVVHFHVASAQIEALCGLTTHNLIE